MKKAFSLFLSFLAAGLIIAQSINPNHEYLIRLNTSVLMKQLITDFNSNSALGRIVESESLAEELDVYKIVLQSHSSDGKSELEWFRNYQGVRYVQENHTNVQLRKNPNDPSYVGQWHLKKINAPDAWDITTGGPTIDGQEIVIAIVDVSFEVDHVDLAQNFWKNKHDSIDGIDNDGNGYLDDYYGWNIYKDTNWVSVNSGQGDPSHGTMVAGVAGAVTDNSSGVASVGWGIKMLPVMSSSTNEATVIKGLNYVLKMRKKYNETNGDSGAFIVACNMSFGVDRESPQNFPLWCDMISELGKAGVICVGAGPNSNTNIDVFGDIPCTCPSNHLISVTRTDSKDFIRGGGFGKTHMDIGAPGIDILTTSLNNRSGTNTGTSFAAPQVTAAIGLMYSVLPQRILDQYKNDPAGLATLVREYVLTNGSRKLANLDSTISSGGVLNLFGAVQVASEGPVLAIQEAQSAMESKITVYPNPSNGKIKVNLNNNSKEELEIKVIDIQGNTVFFQRFEIGEGEVLSVDLGQLFKGVYVLELSTHKETSRRLVQIIH